jgi:hypothetical protein
MTHADEVGQSETDTPQRAVSASSVTVTHAHNEPTAAADLHWRRLAGTARGVRARKGQFSWDPSLTVLLQNRVEIYLGTVLTAVYRK